MGYVAFYFVECGFCNSRLGIGLFQRLTAQEDLPEEGGLVEVGEFGEGPAGVGEEEVGAFAEGDGAGDVGKAHGVGAVQGAGVQGLDGGEAHADAAEGHHEAHVAGGGGSGVVVRCEGDTEACADELLGPSEGDAEEEG